MEWRRLGATSLMVSPIGLGLAALGRPGYINLGHEQDLPAQRSVAAMEQHAHAVLDAAWAGGIRYFDVARSYGRAEVFLASWLHNRGRSPDQVVVGSKWGYTYTANWQVHAQQHEVKEHSLAVIKRQWPESQTHLGPFLRLYQVHSATLSSGILENQPVLAELAQIKASGVAIGLTLSGVDQAATLQAALALTADGVRLFDCVQATWNLLEPSVAAALQTAHAAGMGVIVKEALANGRLTPRNDDPDFATQAALLRAQAERLQTTVPALALAAALAQPWVDVVLSGAASPEQVIDASRALAVQWDEEAAHQLAPLAEPVAAYWATRSELAWN